MIRLAAPLKLVCGWALYFLIFWAVYPLVGAFFHLMTTDLGIFLATSLAAIVGMIAFSFGTSLFHVVSTIERWLDPARKTSDLE